MGFLDLPLELSSRQPIERAMRMRVRAALNRARCDLANLAPGEKRAVRLAFTPQPFAGVAYVASDDIERGGKMIF